MALGPVTGVSYNRTTGLLSWSALTGADRYLVMEKTEIQQPRVQLTSTTGISYNVGVVAEGEFRGWAVIPINDYQGTRGVPSRIVRVSGTKRKIVEQNIAAITATDADFGDGTDADFGDGTDAYFGS